MNQNWFSTRDFLASLKPSEYFDEWGENDPTWAVSDEDLELLLHSMDHIDENHLAFALPIAENNAPAKFAIAAAHLLGHPSMSVRVNAYRVVQAVPQCDITDDLREAVEAGLERCPERQQFADALLRTE